MRVGCISTAVAATLLPTWGDRGWVEGGSSYAGLELEVPVPQACAGIGLLYRVDAGDRVRWLVTGGTGSGF